MASELRVNTLKDAAGNNSIATSFVAQGSAKAWCAMSDSASVNDSLNVASAADNGTGDYQVNLTNSMNNANYSGIGGSQHSAARHVHIDGRTTSDYDVNQYLSTNQTFADGTGTSSSIHGDLA
jgi:hypothetical protein